MSEPDQSPAESPAPAGHATIDRVEGDRAVLDLGGERIDVPLSALPPGVKEGDRLLITVDPAATVATLSAGEARLARMRARARNNPTAP